MVNSQPLLKYEQRNVMNSVKKKPNVVFIFAGKRLTAFGDEFLDSWTYIERAGLTHYKEVNCRN